MDYDLAELAPAGLRPLAREEYDRMIELGFFTDERIELIHGVLVKKMTIGKRHVEACIELNERLVLALHKRARISVGNPLAADELSEPEPDFIVVEREQFESKPPGGAAALVIEVSDSSLRFDRRIKCPLYAAAGVREYWILNLEDDVLEVHRDPVDGAYRQRTELRAGDHVTVAAYPDVSFAVADLIPPREA